METTTATAAPRSNAAMMTIDRRSGRAKRKKHTAQSARREAEAEAEAEAAQSHARWRSESQQKLYTTKLMEALTRLHLTGEDRVVHPRGRAVREVADRALAFTAKGRTRWSRAVLMTTVRKVKLRFRKVSPGGGKGRFAATGPVTMGNGGGRWRGKKRKVSVGRLRGKGAAGVQRKVQVLGSLVPGCRKEPMNVVLDEATDYIAALEMQVKTMTALAHLLSGGDAAAGSGSAAAASGPGTDQMSL